MSSIASIPLAQIDASDRLRPIDESWALAIAESMAERGLMEPIIVRPNGDSYILTAGGHRYRAAELLGWTEIDAIVREMNDLEARMAEIDENLMRRELDPLDRAVFLAERKTIYEELYPETGHGKKKDKSNQHTSKVATVATFHSFSEEVAEKVGLSERSVRRYCQIAAGLSPEVVKLIRQTHLATHLGDLTKFASYPVEQQLEVAQRLASGEVKTLAGANNRTERDEEEVLVERAMALWNRAPAKARRRILTFFGVSPKEVDRIVNPRGVKAEVA